MDRRKPSQTSNTQRSLYAIGVYHRKSIVISHVKVKQSLEQETIFSTAAGTTQTKKTSRDQRKKKKKKRKKKKKKRKNKKKKKKRKRRKKPTKRESAGLERIERKERQTVQAMCLSVVQGDGLVRRGLDDDLQDKVALVVHRAAGNLKGTLGLLQSLEAVRDHVVKRGEYTRAQHSNARSIGVGITEDAENVNLAQVGDGDRQILDGCAHTHHDNLAARSCCVEANVHAHLLARALKSDVKALVLILRQHVWWRSGQSLQLAGEVLGTLKL
jgi:hypothetical protein